MPNRDREISKHFQEFDYETTEAMCNDLEEQIDQNLSCMNQKIFHLFLKRFIKIGLLTTNEIARLSDVKWGAADLWLKGTKYPGNDRARDICSILQHRQRELLGRMDMNLRHQDKAAGA